MRIRQIAFVARDLVRSRDLLTQLFRLDPPFRDLGVGVFGLDNVVFVFGDQFIEVVAPIQDNTAGGRHLDRYGDGGYMLLLQTDRLAADRERIDGLGVRRVRNSDHDDMSASHLHPKDVGGTIVSIDEPRPAAAWRWGGPDWKVQDGPNGRQRIRGLTLTANEPETMARRWGQIFDQPVAARGDGGWRVQFDDQGFADFVPASDGQERIIGFSLKVVEPSAVLARARSMGLETGANWLNLIGAKVDLEAV